MSLTAAEIDTIKRYLGYDLITADAWRGDAAAGLDRNIGFLDDTAIATVRGVLTELAAVDTQITSARGRLKASQVGDLKLNAPGEIATLRGERAILVDDLGRLLGVKARSGNGPGQVIV